MQNRVGCQALLLALLAALGLGSFFLWQQRARWMPPPTDVDRHHGAVWMAHRWLGKSPPEAECRKVGEQLARLGIRDLYFHAGPLDAKGQIPPWNRQEWKRTQELFRESIPGLRSFAWVGGVTVRGFGVAPDTVDVAEPLVREAIVDTCKVLLDEGGFDGLHYDLEPIDNGDPYFLTLLEETRVGLGTHRQLSVAVPASWDKKYFKLVAERCDQVAMMGYDQSHPTAAKYEEWLEGLVPVACEVLAGTKCRLIMGVASHDEPSGHHDPQVENMLTGLVGIKRGLERTPNRAPFQGVGVYAQWTTDAAEWQTFEDCWQP